MQSSLRNQLNETVQRADKLEYGDEITVNGEDCIVTSNSGDYIQYALGGDVRHSYGLPLTDNIKSDDDLSEWEHVKFDVPIL